MNRNKNEINKIISALENCYFEDLGDWITFENNVVIPFKEKYHNNVESKTGASKGVLIFKDFGFVIKIPFMYDDCGDELEGAFLSLEPWNYCQQEVEKFNEIKGSKIEKMFVKTEFLTEVNGYPVYIQDYAESCHNNYIKHGGSSHTDKDENKIISLTEENNYKFIDVEWEADVFNRYGEEFYKLFKEEIDNYEIDDLREDNLGYVNECPVIIDYAGFFG